MKYFKKIVGKKCYLSPVSYDDVEKYTEWINDMETGVFVLFASNVIGVAKEKEILMHLDQNDIIFAIIDKESNNPLGFCGLHNKNEIHRSAVLGITIADKNYWGHGIGTEAVQLLLDFGFNMLNLHSISLDVFSYNTRAIKCYEKCGFKYAGKKREAVFIAGKYHDVQVYDILFSDFTSPSIISTYDKVVSKSSNSEKITIA